MTGYWLDATTTLEAPDCWELVAGTHVARLAVSVGGAPDIYPVTVHAAGDVLAFRTVPGTKLATLVTNDRVALEWDDVSPDGAWSVVVKGTARRLETTREIAAVQSPDADDDAPLVDVPTEDWVRVEPREVSGRRFRRRRGEPDM
jgi:uncharacterized protein